ncbi:hypothetical protein N665_0106s0039 [Sinapis alba]|nr:hypothetical protein N665_0106s0039 [Sinapis alba]
MDKFMIRLPTLGQELKTYGRTWIVALESASPGTLEASLGYGVSQTACYRESYSGRLKTIQKKWELDLEII